MAHGARMPWYPTVNLVRQTVRGDWTPSAMSGKGLVQSLKTRGVTFVAILPAFAITHCSVKFGFDVILQYRDPEFRIDRTR